MSDPNSTLSRPLPSRRDIKNFVAAFAQRPGPAVPVMRLVADYALWVMGLLCVALVTPLWAKLIGCALLWIASARLFIIGHDACHGSYTNSATWNRVLGRIAFLPTLTAYSLWEVGHNVAHHGYNNLRTHDFVWAPLTRAEYDQLSPLKRFVYRLYRSGWWPGLYYLVEIWWNKMFFPNRSHMPTRRKTFLYDNLGASAFGLGWLGVLATAAFATGQSSWLLLTLGFAVPFFLWSSLMGWAIYVHHTHPDVQWYLDKSQWLEDRVFATGTVHVTLPAGLGAVLHNIMDHTAHHVDMSVPFVNLPQAQAHLESQMTDAIVVQPFSVKSYFEHAKACALYDFEKMQWEPIAQR